MPVKKYLHDVDLVANQLLNSRLHNLTTAQRVALGATLNSSHKGYQVYDTNLLTPFFWDGNVWSSGVAPSTLWGSISGTLTSQTDLITYLTNNYYPLANPAGYLNATAADLLYYPLSTNPAGYLISFTETDPTVPAAVKAITNTQISNWDTAYGWGDHATAGYLTSAVAASTYVPLNRNITINGTTFDLSVDRSWTISTASGTWGSITGTLSSQTDLQNALNTKFDNPSGTTLQYLRGDGSLATFPTIPPAQVNSDWNAVSGLSEILNKPVLATVATSGNYNDLSNLPTIPAAQVNSNWNATFGVAQILNKPVLATVATSGSYNDLLNLPILPTGTVTSISAGTGMSFPTITSSGVINIDTTKVPLFNTGFSPGFVKWNGSSWVFDNSTYLTGITSSDVTTALGYTPVANARTITINGTTFDLTADRTWNVGTVTSVGLTMPAAFSVASSPVTGAGTLAVTALGNASQYIRGDGVLANLPTTPVSGGASVNYYLNGSVNQGTIGGNTYYELSKTPILGTGTDFTRTDAQGNGIIARFITDVNDPSLLAIPAGNFIFLNYFSASSGGGSPQFYITLSKYDGTTFTLIADNSANPEVIDGGTSIDLYYTALAVPLTALALTDRLVIDVHVITGGRNITLHTEGPHLSEVQTTLSTGLTALNGSTDSVQFFQQATSGTDFNISTSLNTHTFNLPVASAINTGKLSNTDWTIFNNKVSSVGATPPLASSGGTTPTISIGDAAADGTTKGAATFDSNDFNSAAGVISIDYVNGQSASSSTKGFLTAADWLTFSGKQNAISFSTTGTNGAATFIGNNLNIPVYTLAGLGGQPQLNGTGFVKASGTAISYDNTSYTPESRTITINGLSQDLSANRTWSVGDLLSSGSYSNPTWLTTLAWSKITGTPTSLAGYGITDSVVLTTGSYADPSWITSLAYSKLTGAPTNVSAFTNDAGYITSSALSPYLTSATAASTYVSLTGSYADPSWITSLDWSKITNVPALGGLSSLNTLTATTQTFAIGTSGTNFNISSVGSVHTFNLPNASATNRGALTASDWTTFDSKEPAIAAGTTLQYYRGDKTFQTLNTAAVPELTNLYYTDARARQSIFLTTTGTSGVSTYNNITGVLNVPQYGGTGGSGFGYTLVMGFNVTALAANETYVIGTLYGSGAITLFENRPSRWVLCPKVGNIVSASVVVQLNSASYGSPTSSQMQIRVHNITQSTNSVIDAAYQITSALFSGGSTPARNTFYNITPLAVNQGDQIQVRIVTPAWTTPPGTMSMNIILFIE